MLQYIVLVNYPVMEDTSLDIHHTDMLRFISQKWLTGVKHVYTTSTVTFNQVMEAERCAPSQTPQYLLRRLDAIDSI